MGEEPQRIGGNGIGERENRDSVNEFLCHPFSGFSKTMMVNSVKL